MSWFSGIFFVLVILLVAAMLYFRLAPIDQSAYIKSAKTAPSDGQPHEYRLAGEAAPVFALPAPELAGIVDEYIKSRPRTRQIGGYAKDLQAVYEVRSLLFGFPDFVSVDIDAVDENHARLNIFSRSHYGRSDLGANKKRVEAWIAGIDRTVAGR